MVRELVMLGPHLSREKNLRPDASIKVCGGYSNG